LNNHLRTEVFGQAPRLLNGCKSMWGIPSIPNEVGSILRGWDIVNECYVLGMRKQIWLSKKPLKKNFPRR
jgi:hypothetical protein